MGAALLEGFPDHPGGMQAACRHFTQIGLRATTARRFGWDKAIAPDARGHCGSKGAQERGGIGADWLRRARGIHADRRFDLQIYTAGEYAINLA